MIEQAVFETTDVRGTGQHGYEDNGVYRVGERLSRDRLQDGGDAAVQVTWLRILCMPVVATEACGEVRCTQHCWKWACGEGSQRSSARLCLRHGQQAAGQRVGLLKESVLQAQVLRKGQAHDGLFTTGIADY